jgi:Na+/proline symporter
MAGVLTGDVYHRMVNPQATERQLVFVGRLATVLVGGLTILIGIALVETARKGLFGSWSQSLGSSSDQCCCRCSRGC